LEVFACCFFILLVFDDDDEIVVSLSDVSDSDVLDDFGLFITIVFRRRVFVVDDEVCLESSDSLLRG
jgi:hypothetical protein